MAKKKLPKPKSLDEKISNHGLSVQAIEVILGKYPKGKPDAILRGFAKFMLTAESSVEAKWLPFSLVVITRKFPEMGGVFLERIRPVSFHLPGGIYTPDFYYLMNDGSRIVVEVKGSKFQSNYRDARGKLRAAATLNPDHVFCEVMPNRESENGWSVEVIEPDEDYGKFLSELKSAMEAVR